MPLGPRTTCMGRRSAGVSRGSEAARADIDILAGGCPLTQASRPLDHQPVQETVRIRCRTRRGDLQVAEHYLLVALGVC